MLLAVTEVTIKEVVVGRPRRPFGGVETITASETPWMGLALGVRQRIRWDGSRHWSYQQPNGLYDPLTYLFVLDAVANIDPDIELRARNLVPWLFQAVPQFLWDSITVGKVLSDLCDAFEDVLGEKHGILERGKDYLGLFYRIHHTEEVARVYQALREELMGLASVEMAARRNHDASPRLASPLLECPSVRGEFPSESA